MLSSGPADRAPPRLRRSEGGHDQHVGGRGVLRIVLRVAQKVAAVGGAEGPWQLELAEAE
jgi:hypothetical protein